MSDILTFRSKQISKPGLIGGDTVTGQAGKPVGSDSYLPPMKRTSQPKSAGGSGWGEQARGCVEGGTGLWRRWRVRRVVGGMWWPGHSGFGPI